jgi:hypothetical protein
MQLSGERKRSLGDGAAEARYKARQAMNVEVKSS